MICHQCGLKLMEEAKFCPRCGAPAMPSPERPVQKKVGLPTVLLAVLSAILAVILILQNSGVVGLVAGKGTARLEGKGYASAEKAVEAYVKAMKQGDVPAMLSTFAIESYIDSYDTEAGLFRLRAWIPTALSDGTYRLVGNDYERQLRIHSRQASISQRLYGQLLTCSAFLSDDLDSFDPGMAITFENEKDVREFLRVYRESSFGKALTEMKIEKFVDPKDLNEAYGSEANLKNMAERSQIFGCEGYKSVAALVTLDGEEWLLTMDCANYNGRWYNLTPSGTLSTLLGADAHYYGLFPYAAIEW